LNLSLRGKSLLAVALASVLALAVAGAIAWQALRSIEAHYGAAFARNYAVVLKQQMVAPINRELALALRLARSELTRDWLLDEGNAEKRALFFREAEGYRQDFLDRSLFVATASSLNYYFNDEKAARNDRPRYKLDPALDKDAWFFKTLKTTEPYDINVSPDPELGLTKVWLNFLVRDGDKNIAIAGTGLDLTAFVKNFVQSPEAGVSTIAIDQKGAIQAHRDVSKIAYRAGHSNDDMAKNFASLLGSAAERKQLNLAMASALLNPDTANEFVGTLDGKRQVIALSWSPQLKWYVIAAADLSVAQFFNFKLLLPLLAAAAALLGVALVGFLSALNKFLLIPITQLTNAASKLSRGEGDFKLPPVGKDEMGQLSRAFGDMSEEVKTHRLRLEEAVHERTQALQKANQELARLSERDVLTGLGNRRMLLAQLKLQDVEVRRTPKRGMLTLALLDIDHFKLINDNYGHEAGDVVLVRVAETIEEQVRATDVAGRWGGEEFLIILPGTTANESRVVMERLVQAIASLPIAYGDQILHVKASIGMAQIKPNETINELIQRADHALYEAKDAGRNRVIFV
jgi:phosphoserine phosphatase RsbU/P